MTVTITVAPYQPGTPLDRELAHLGYAAMVGWADQRPVTDALVRSRLRPPANGAATTVFLARSAGGALSGAAALRQPTAPGGPARVWGPIVDPSCQRRGLGTALLAQVLDTVTDPTMVVYSAEIPARRRHGWDLFHRAGWHLHATAALLKGPITALPGAADPPQPHAGPQIHAVTPAHADALARLYHAVHPAQGVTVAADTDRRWRADDRFINEGLLGVTGRDGELEAAVLLYPLAHTEPGEPTEALLADVLIHPAADRPALAGPMISAALAAGARHGAHVARAIVPATASKLLADLQAAGLRTVEEIYYYQAPPLRTAHDAISSPERRP
ncbi:GNAT family N-acetyltransferase [Streptosporangium sp. CA-115845]|uniref:GNAT family N-acetyltransferase n=1 Tax=Streptosporangium sp. CA-115845 TaxID=3240071 RepID=UPI003D9316DA